MKLNYYLIGQRIRSIRKEKNLSQAKLAELTDYSTPHIGHIEQASTKLSVAALVDIANALDVTTDKILSDVVYQSKEYLKDELAMVVKDCSSNEMYVIIQLAKTVKEAIRNQNM